MIDLPSVNLIGIVESTANKNKFVPHYAMIPKLYPNTRFTPIEPRSVMFTKSAFDQLDFWNLDADFFFVEDMINYNELLGYSGKHFDYFSGFLKVLRIAHGHFEKENMLDKEWSKNKQHLMDIYASMLVSNIILVSPILEELLIKALTPLFSKQTIQFIQNKFLVLPPPDMYKLKVLDIEQKFDKLIFLWNHRFYATKRPKEFFEIIEEFCKTYPNVPVRILITSSLTQDGITKYIPKSIQNKIKIVPFVSDTDKYTEVIQKANITLGTSEVESFGVAVFDAIKAGLVVLNLPQNKAFSTIVGTASTFARKEIVATIYKIYKSQKFREQILAKNLQGLCTLPNRKDYRKKLSNRLRFTLAHRLEATPATSNKLLDVIKLIRKEKVVTKRQIYEAMGWKSTGSIINSFWSSYYYGLRKLGVDTTKVNDKLYFHMAGYEINKEIESKQQNISKGGLFL